MASTPLRQRYHADHGSILLSGTQALARLLLLQARIDRKAGLDTAGFVSGYRGSPLGALDQQLWRLTEELEAERITFRPAVNEDLAATAIWGTQQAQLIKGAKHDGVFSMWYGKGPGVDRSGDPVRHANRQGTAAHGGVLMVFGDDHGAKSSTVAHNSEPMLAGLGVPVLYPGSVQEILDFGLFGYALSRFAGTWVGLKCVNETLETTATADADITRVTPILPDVERPEGGLNTIPGYDPVGSEERLVRYRLPAVHAFVRANGIDRDLLGGSNHRLALVAAGKSAGDVRAALRLLGIDDARATELGIGLYKPGLIWPLEPTGLREFADGATELLVIEEKLPFLEPQVASALFNLPDGRRPRLSGHLGADGGPLLPGHGQLDPQRISRLIATRLDALGIDYDRSANGNEIAVSPPGARRLPYFCAGCPHNTSTRTPEGSIAMSGIGCHTMAVWMDRDTLPPTQMGGEGANWTGIAPFTDRRHMFQNLGDGTYAHSGLLAIRAAVQSGANITYKLLYNDAVAMTGGQPVDGNYRVADMVRQIAAEGVTTIEVVSDAPERFTGDEALPDGLRAVHRDHLDAIQRRLREVPGTSLLVYDQVCATEKRRRRKRGRLEDPARWVFINPEVCEGCGDCSLQANCVAIAPLETEFGTKRQIDLSLCNKDYSCLRGRCPALVTIEGGQLRRPEAANIDESALADLPAPPVAPDERAILIGGIGGTGVVTVGALLAMAAHLEGRGASVFDMTGIAQKNGAVYSHLRMTRDPAGPIIHRIGPGEADLLLGCDLVVTAAPDAMATVVPGRTRAIVNSAVTPTADFQLNPDHRLEAGPLLAALATAVGDGLRSIDASGHARELLGDTIGSNLYLVGYALQSGELPVAAESIERAIELNGVAVDFNKRAFRLGRLSVIDPERIAGWLPAAAAAPGNDIGDLVGYRAKALETYQNRKLANRYRALVTRVAGSEKQLGSESLTRAVARGYHHLLAYKDEYEVARMHSSEAFKHALADAFEGDYTVHYHLAPTWIAGESMRKRSFGPWLTPLLGLLARGKGLRGSALNPFGWSSERRMERRLIGEYETLVNGLLIGLTAENLATRIELAELPLKVRGYGAVKLASVKQMEQRKAALLAPQEA